MRKSFINSTYDGAWGEMHDRDLLVLRRRLQSTDHEEGLEGWQIQMFGEVKRELRERGYHQC